MPRDPRDESAAEWAERTRRAQGLPAKITDPVVLRRVAVLMTSGDRRREVRDAAA